MTAKQKGSAVLVMVLVAFLAVCQTCIGATTSMTAIGALASSTSGQEQAGEPSQPMLSTQTANPQNDYIFPTVTKYISPTRINTPFRSTTEAVDLTPTRVQSPTRVQVTQVIPTNTIVILPTRSPTLPASSVTGCIPSTTARQIGVVTKVVDGDTIDVQLADGQSYRVRYIGINTPETNEPFYSDAKAQNSALVLSKTVTLVKDVSETDKYGRLLRYILVGNTFVNYELVRWGYANASTYPPDVACQSLFSSSEYTARVNLLGLWGISVTSTKVVSLPTATTGSGGGGGDIPTPTSGGGSAVCDCSDNRYNCDDFLTQGAAQACFEYCIAQGRGDIHRLDADDDGVACESLP